MDDARAAGLKVAVCSAATKSSVVFTLKSLLGEQRFNSLDCFLAGRWCKQLVGIHVPESAGVSIGERCRCSVA
jgi:hypothetical protein